MLEMAQQVGVSPAELLEWLRMQGSAAASTRSRLTQLQMDLVLSRWEGTAASSLETQAPEGRVVTTCDGLPHPARPLPGEERAWDVEGCYCGRRRHGIARVLTSGNSAQSPQVPPTPEHSQGAARKEPGTLRQPRTGKVSRGQPQGTRGSRKDRWVSLAELAGLLGDSPAGVRFDLRAAGVYIRRPPASPLGDARVRHRDAAALIERRTAHGRGPLPIRVEPALSRALRPPASFPSTKTADGGGEAGVEQWLEPPLAERTSSRGTHPVPSAEMPPIGPRSLPARRDWVARRRGLSTLPPDLAEGFTDLRGAQPLWATAEMIRAADHTWLPDGQVRAYVVIPHGLLAFAEPVTTGSVSGIVAISWRYTPGDECMHIHAWREALNPAAGIHEWLPAAAAVVPISSPWPSRRADRELIDLVRRWWAVIAERAPRQAGVEEPVPVEPPGPSQSLTGVGLSTEETRTRLRTWRSGDSPRGRRGTRAQLQRTGQGWWVRSFFRRQKVLVDGQLEMRLVFVGEHRRGDGSASPGGGPISVVVLEP